MYIKPSGEDQETDVVVIGTGPGGLSSVGSAVAAGAEVIAIEAHDNIGGNGLLSTGWVIFVDTPMQRSQNIQDSVDLFMKDCKKLVDESSLIYGLVWDEKLSRIFAENSAEMYEILTKRGVRFDRLIKRPLQTSVDRLAAVEDTKMFPAAFERDFAGPHVKTYLQCSAQRLLVEDGVVKGVRVQPRDGSRSFIVRARKGVILATGGYQANPALRRHYQVDKTAMDIYPGLPTCRGDGHLLGQALGGDLVNMTMIPPIIAVASHLTESAIAVNISGCRFHDEAGPYLDRVKALEWQNQQKGFYIFDGKTFADKRFYVDQMPGERDSAATLEELAAKIGVPGDALTLSVQQWNNFLASGTDQEEGTGRVQFAPDRRGIIEAPFYSSPMISGVSLSVGGFVTTETMQVVDVFGQVIPGLFAVGDCAGGLTPTAEMGGTHLGGGFVLGWVAGRAAATGQNSLPHTSATFGQSMDQRVQMSGPIINVAAAQI
ncbi:hypothetical protein V502_05443 [Pseudogymnoascus sp. VKM F-4520 (FW-2644)]|nr:hypothetical protein V502_05443 [Pseudogymnoascus sp. VKM F-4520 (FW-2644)]